MTEIIAGELVYNELTKNANGGTEQMARRVARDVDHDLLKNFQIIFSRIRDTDNDLKKIFYAHDLAQDPEAAKLADPNILEKFDAVVCVSNWQAQMYNLSLGVPYSKMKVIPNAVEPFGEFKRRDFDVIRIIYHTTPHRGLGILVPVFDHLSKIHPNIHLDVFSSFGIYGWDSRDKDYEGLFNHIRNHPKMTYHGWQPNDIVREYLTNSHIFAYPSIWPETSCIAAIEAMMAGCNVVHPNYAALPETTGGLTAMYDYTENHQNHANRFANALNVMINAAMNHSDIFSREQELIAIYGANRYNWFSSSVHRWNRLLKELNNGEESQSQSQGQD